MNKKRLTLIVVLIAILALVWLLALKTATSTEHIDTQNALVAEADGLAAKELYVRAIPLYEEALTYETDRIPEIEEKLLSALLGFESYDKYCKLVESRDAAGRAKVEEYVTAAEIYLGSLKLVNAISLIDRGIDALGAQALYELGEANRYAYKLRTTKYSEIVTSADNYNMLGKNGDKWYFIDEDGRTRIDAGFDETYLPNARGFVVVSQDGTFYCLDGSGNRYGVDENPLEEVFGINDRFIIAKQDGLYGYYNADFQLVSESHRFDEVTMNSNGFAAVRKGDKWGTITDGLAAGIDFIFEDVALSSCGTLFTENAGMVKHNGLWYLIDPGANKLSEEGFSDAKAPESTEPVAVANASGKWGFIDRTGALVIDYQFDDAKSFSNGLAAVKQGGDWCYVNLKGEVVIDESFEEATPFKNGIATVKTRDGIAIIQLELAMEE